MSSTTRFQLASFAAFLLLGACSGLTTTRAVATPDAEDDVAEGGGTTIATGSDGGDGTVGSDAGDGMLGTEGCDGMLVFIDKGQGSNDVEGGGICVLPDAATLTLPNLDTPCYGGSTGRELLARVAPTYASTFRPTGPPPGYAWSGSLTPTALALTFTYSGGSVECSPPPPPDCDPGGPCSRCSPCGVGPGIISLPLDVTFKTADGAFDEQFVANATYVPGGQVQWQGSMPASQLHGTYPPILSPNETVIFQGAIAGASYDNGIVDEFVPNKISGGGGSWLTWDAGGARDAFADGEAPDGDASAD